MKRATPEITPANGDLHQPAGASRRRVLVVDDNVDALKTLSMLVTLLGNDVRQAHDGIEAIEVADTFRPEVVLMDLGMPKLSGYEAARRIRQEPWGLEMVLIATTGWGQEEDRRRTRQAGFDHHLVKPVDPDKLQELLAGLVTCRLSEAPSARPTPAEATASLPSAESNGRAAAQTESDLVSNEPHRAALSR